MSCQRAVSFGGIFRNADGQARRTRSVGAEIAFGEAAGDARAARQSNQAIACGDTQIGDANATVIKHFNLKVIGIAFQILRYILKRDHRAIAQLIPGNLAGRTGIQVTEQRGDARSLEMSEQGRGDRRIALAKRHVAIAANVEYAVALAVKPDPRSSAEIDLPKGIITQEDLCGCPRHNQTSQIQQPGKTRNKFGDQGTSDQQKDDTKH